MINHNHVNYLFRFKLWGEEAKNAKSRERTTIHGDALSPSSARTPHSRATHLTPHTGKTYSRTLTKA